MPLALDPEVDQPRPMNFFQRQQLAIKNLKNRPGHKRQRVDATSAMILKGNLDREELESLRKLMSAMRKGIAIPSSRGVLNKPTTLYKRYRGKRFPISGVKGRWRDTSTWMKCQMALLCLSEVRFIQFRVTLHDELLAELVQRGRDPKTYLRDRIKRCIRDEIGKEAWFMFVIEDRNQEGEQGPRPHVHGSIQIHRAKLRSNKDGSTPLPLVKTIQKLGLEEMEYLVGRKQMVTALRLASGNNGKKPSIVNGISQVGNVWHRKKYFAYDNSAHVTYMLKNAKIPSNLLADHRLSMSRSLNQEARRLWNLITKGEPALAQWV